MKVAGKNKTKSQLAKATGSIKRDVELLFEVSAFRHVDRTWQQFLGPDVANNAEHTFRVAWIALTLARYEKNVDLAKLLKLALVHDLPESRCGDVHYLSRQYVKRDEVKAGQDIFAGTVHQAEMLELLAEYEARQTLEAKLLKDADNLDVQLELREVTERGHSMGTVWQKDRQARVYPKLFTQAARQFWQEINRANPHNWHNRSLQNRYHGGDWQVKK